MRREWSDGGGMRVSRKEKEEVEDTKEVEIRSGWVIEMSKEWNV